MSEERWQIYTQGGDYRYVVQDTEDKFSFMCFQDEAVAEGVANLLNDAASALAAAEARNLRLELQLDEADTVNLDRMKQLEAGPREIAETLEERAKANERMDVGLPFQRGSGSYRAGLREAASLIRSRLPSPVSGEGDVS